MTPPPPAHLLLAAGPDALGATDLIAAFELVAMARHGAAVLLTEGGLAWAGTPALARFSDRYSVDVAVCSRSARDAGWRLQDGSAPAFVRWSSLATWLADREPGVALWVALP